MKVKDMTTEKLLERKKELEEIILKPEETDDYIKLPVHGESGKHKNHKIRWITVSKKEGIKGLYCIDCKKIITYIFDKKSPHNWTLEKAKAWMEKHGKAVSDYFEKVDWDVEYDIEEVDWEKVEASIKKEEEDEDEKDLEMNDLINRICEINIENKELREKLEELELKAGAVLNAKNKKDLKTAQALIQSVLDSATTGEEEDSLEITNEKGEDDKTDNIVIDLVTDTVDDPPLDEKEDESKIEVDDKVIADCITKHMNYLVGKLDKSDT